MITEILSEENISLHKEYVRQQRLKYSILESDLPCLKGAKVNDLFHIRLDKKDREKALELLSEAVLHDIFFDSFCEEENRRCEIVSAIYGSESAFLHELYKRSKELKYGFLAVDGAARIYAVSECQKAFRYGEPRLAVDLCEHAYFFDYGFDRERYIITCLSHLNLKKITTENREV